MITPVLLCGGSGTRLWPMSRNSHPKQFTRIHGENSLLQATALRLAGEGFAPPVIVTNAAFRYVVAEQMMAIGIAPQAILIEPEARNTAPAILAATLWIAARDPQAMLLIAPSDHLVYDAEALKSAIRAGRACAEQGDVVTFGVPPTRAATGYGYLELAAPADRQHPVALSRFVEKPDPAQAELLLARENVLWNTGIFLLSAQGTLAAFETHAAEMLVPVRAAVVKASDDFGFVRLDATAWSEVADISIDYAIMEKADNVHALRFDGGWSDMGGWNTVWSELVRDEHGVARSGATTAIDCENTLLRSEDAGLELVGIGLRDIVAIATPDAVLVSRRGRGDDLRKAVAMLKTRRAPQATGFPAEHCAWGRYESLASDAHFQINRAVVKPGATMMLQSHRRDGEHWVVVEGTARVSHEDAVVSVPVNATLPIRADALHRIENPGDTALVLIEVRARQALPEPMGAQSLGDFAPA